MLSIAPASRPERAPHFTTLGSLRRPAFGPGWRFLPTRRRAPLTSDVPLPLPRRRVNAAGFDASPEHLRSLLAAATPPTGFHRRRLGPRGPTVGRNQRRAHTDTTTLNDFCNRQQPEHTRKRSLTRRAAAFHDNTLHLAVLRRRALGAPAAQVESQPRARRGRRLSSWKRTSLSRASASAPWRETRSSKAHQGPPRARRANGRASGTSQDAFRCTRSRPVLFDPEWSYFGELAPASYAPFIA